MASRFYSETEVVAHVEGLTVARLRTLVTLRCIEPIEREGRLAFAEADLARARLVADLNRDFELDDEATALVLSLVDQIHGLRRRLRALGEALAEEPEEVRARLRLRLGPEGEEAGPRRIR
jgi:chaperone modulatory protein CbpM